MTHGYSGHWYMFALTCLSCYTIYGSDRELFSAASVGRYQFLEEALQKQQKRVTTMTRIATGETLLHTTCWYGRKECARLLLSQGALIQPTTIEGRTPLHYATLRGHEGIVRMLVEEYKAQVECYDNKLSSPLDYALEKRHWTTVCILLLAGATKTRVPAYQNLVTKFAALNQSQKEPIKTALEGAKEEQKALVAFKQLQTIAPF